MITMTELIATTFSTHYSLMTQSIGLLLFYFISYYNYIIHLKKNCAVIFIFFFEILRKCNSQS